MPTRLGGLGLRSAVATADAAYWASWADSLPMIQKRNPVLAERILTRLEAGDVAAESCLGELLAARDRLASEGFSPCPTWRLVL